MALESSAKQVPSSPGVKQFGKSRNIIKIFIMEILVLAVNVSFYLSRREKRPHHSS